ncbi:MAG TPA: tetratricopeptide repeat protein [Verrucomicrobiae bacterium]|nr:tetratricopeptide repeat protein [Verrucomicrobiae bacterium]
MSSARITLPLVLLLPLGIASLAAPMQQAPSSADSSRASTAANQATTNDPARLFQDGQQALSHARLDDAERDFRAVLALDPRAGAAYANLGVIHMRKKQWALALADLQRAERMMPQVAGIRLNIGLAYYHQNEFLKAIPPFESVVHDQPDALQPRYLLGLCYFFAERWTDAASTLEPLWAQESGQFPYLYVLSNAAHRAGRKDLDDRATAQLIRLGDGTPEYHLFVGKYYLNLEQADQAMTEFQAAEKADPRLPFVHFNLGLAYLKKQDYPHARQEFLKDAAVEPDLSLNYDKLGDVYWLLQDDANAERSYREALRRDPRLVSSRLGLAKIYEHEKKYAQALAETTAAEKIDPSRSDAHYMRGRLLLQMNRKDEAKKELDAARKIDIEQSGHPAPQAGTVPSPELLQDPQ